MDSTNITSQMQFNDASDEHKEKGVVGWVSFNVFNSFRINSVAVRQSRTGVVSLSYPAKKSGEVLNHYVRPLNNEVRLKVEDEILGVLGYETPDSKESSEVQ